jgi:hypothetical protein
MLLLARIIAMLGISALGSWLAYHAWTAVRTGAANVRSVIVLRQTRPGFFWTAVVVRAGFAVVCFTTVIRVLLRWQ